MVVGHKPREQGLGVGLPVIHAGVSAHAGKVAQDGQVLAVEVIRPLSLTKLLRLDILALNQELKLFGCTAFAWGDLAIAVLHAISNQNDINLDSEGVPAFISASVRRNSSKRYFRMSAFLRSDSIRAIMIERSGFSGSECVIVQQNVAGR